VLSLKDKVAIVTGCGSSGPGWGNGKATAVLFAVRGRASPASTSTPPPLPKRGA